jgi:hypothetical protein
VGSVIRTAEQQTEYLRHLVKTTVSSEIPGREIPQEVRTVMDLIFKEMMDCKPSWKATFKAETVAMSQTMAVDDNNALFSAMLHSKIDTMEKAMFGINALRVSVDPFFPPVGRFVHDCKTGWHDHLRQQQMRDNTKRIIERNRMLPHNKELDMQVGNSAIEALRNITHK